MKSPNKELLEKYKAKMIECTLADPESNHMEADNVLSELLRELGYGEVVDIFDDIHKWYS